MSNILIKTFNENEQDEWDTLVEETPFSTIWHKYKWLQLIEKYTGWKNINIGGFLGDQCVIAIPIFVKKKGLFNIINSPPSGVLIPFLGPIIPNYEKLKQNKIEYYFGNFQEKIEYYIQKKFHPINSVFITSPGLIDIRPYIWHHYNVIPKYNYICKKIELDAIWNNFKKELRKNINKTKKAGVEIQYERKKSSYDKIIDLMLNRLNDQEIGAPASNDYLHNIFEEFSPDVIKIFTCLFNDEILSGIITTAYKKHIQIWIGATQCNLSGIYPVDLCQWEILKWADENGFDSVEIIGANIPQNSYFKSRYNLELIPYYLVRKSRYNWALEDIFNLINKSK